MGRFKGDVARAACHLHVSKVKVYDRLREFGLYQKWCTRTFKHKRIYSDLGESWGSATEAAQALGLKNASSVRSAARNGWNVQKRNLSYEPFSGVTYQQEVA
jgi:hypothetical protein